MSPTSYTVLHATLKYAQTFANKIGQKEIVLTYDLAIAKMAMPLDLHFEQFCLENEFGIVEDFNRIHDNPLEPNEVFVMSPLLDDVINKYV